MRDSLDILRIDDFVEHHGVKGMKWGVRKQQYKQNVKTIKQKYKKANKALYKERRKEIQNYLIKPSVIKNAMTKMENIHSYKDKVDLARLRS